MVRVISALTILPVVIGIIWFLPAWATFVLAQMVLLLSFREYMVLARGFGAAPYRLVTLVVMVATVTAAPQDLMGLILMVGMLALGVTSLMTARSGGQVLLDVSASVLPLLYIGVPLGTFVALRISVGREAVLLLLATIVVSDTAQYYGGRWLGRTPLAPVVSPKKTREGALFGVGAGMAFMLACAPRVFGSSPVFDRVVLGAVIVVLGIAGDLFESQLKRGAGLKDSSSLIPGHGGILDRLDSLFFAAPAFYLYLRLVGEFE